MARWPTPVSSRSPRGTGPPLTKWRTVVDINLIGVWNTCAAAIPHLLDQGGGSLVNVSSAGASKGFPLQTPYTAAKHGVVG